MRGRHLEKLIYETALEITVKAVEIDMPQCKFCQSKHVVKNGKRNGTQYYLCRNCGRGFVYNKALPRMRYPIDIVADAVYDYYAGVSLNKIKDGIKQKIGLRPADSAIYGWVKRLTRIGLAEARKHIPKVGNKWLADETVIRLKDGKKYWLINVIDFDTRFVLASKLSSSRNAKDIASAFAQAKRNAGKISPKVLMTDGWRAYEDGIEYVFGADTKHIRSKPFTVEDNTNLIERFHGTLKDRTKVMRGLKNIRTARLITEGWLLHYNYLRPHESLNDRIPAQVAGIKYPYKNWQDIVAKRVIITPKQTSATSAIRIPDFIPIPRVIRSRKVTKRRIRRQKQKSYPALVKARLY